MYVCVMAVAIIGCLTADLRSGNQLHALLKQKKQQLFLGATQFNNQVKALKQSYQRDLNFFNSPTNIFSRLTNQSKESIRRDYEAQYQRARAAFALQAQTILREWDKAQTPAHRTMSRVWKSVIVVGILTQFMTCSYSTFQSEIASMPVRQADEAWTAESVPMPHLTDGSRYVSNPDSIISPQTETRLNRQLKQLDDELNIESAVIIVNHVKDQDIFRFAQDVFDIYKVGKDDRGLVFVLAYEDHLLRTHTGRALEADLTDVECFRLQERYLIPSMKAEQPDSGMLYWTTAVYNLLQKKELPVMGQLERPVNDDPADDGAIIVMLYLIVFMGWIALYFILSARHGWNLSHYAYQYLLPNPFVRPSMPVIITTGGGGRGFGGGGGFGGVGGFGGGFSGGSSGGGGATSSW